MLSSLPRPRFDVASGARALAAILRNPDDLAQVFVLIDAMSGTAPARMVFRFRRSDGGRRLLRERPDIVTRLADREGLRALPAGSLGREYLAFVESEGISAEGIRTASETERPFLSPEAEYIHGRLRDTHDLWHAATGYKGDVLGELSLLAFTLAQHWNTAIGAIVVAGVLKGFGRTDVRLVYEGYLRGRRAAWLPAQPWEDLLALPIDAVRARLEVGPPPEYTPVRTTELRAAGMIGG